MTCPQPGPIIGYAPPSSYPCHTGHAPPRTAFTGPSREFQIATILFVVVVAVALVAFFLRRIR